MEHKDFKYYVIELSDPPYSDPDKYVCVPNSWVRLHDTTDSTAVVKFPIEELSETKKRMERGEEFSKDWMIFCADVKCATNSYSDAKKYIKTLDIISLLEQNNMEYFPEDIHSTSGMGKMLELMSLDTNQVGSASALRSKVIEPAGNQTTSENVHFTNPQMELHQARTKVIGTADFISKPKKYWTRRSLTQPSPPNTDHSMNVNAREDSMETSSCDEDIGMAQQTQENESSIKTPSSIKDKSLILIVLQRVFSDDHFKGNLKKLRSELENLSIMFEKMHLAFANNCTTVSELIEYTNLISDFKIEDFIDASEEIENYSIEKETTINNMANNEVTKLGEQQAQREDEQNNNDKNITDESEDEEEQSPRQKNRDRTRKFTLPPEYDPNNSKWTLKHRKKKKGVVELVPHTGVYINAIRLNYCKLVAKNSQTLARMLLVEIFSQNALCTCSITGRQSHIFDPKGTNVRPGLDKDAMSVLLNYVSQYTRDKNWPYPETAVMNSLRCKLNEIRAKNA